MIEIEPVSILGGWIFGGKFFGEVTVAKTVPSQGGAPLLLKILDKNVNCLIFNQLAFLSAILLLIRY